MQKTKSNNLSIMFNKIGNKIKKLHWSQWVYVWLWALFSFLLITLIVLFGSYKGFVITDEMKATKHVAQMQAFNKIRSDVIASVAFVFTIVFFNAIIFTVISHGFILKKLKINKKFGGKK
ncbi:hypothetical protein BCF59_0738 [Mycoplasmopsis mustelae]|uniref:Uncharacterized protein n=1 Tax=Mycoplasmopsis mustelae TaxID=171289 RepID=A0A4R7UE22_9BACT|nr:hypothetical protein [Mycoplasmopsis mustelae]TDV22702.1 hypothetical protein BCF59_0738 [Mycoplasmopsis mustelae]